MGGPKPSWTRVGSSSQDLLFFQSFLGQMHPSKPEMRGRALGWGRHRRQQSSQRRPVHMVLPRARVATCLTRDTACLSRGSPTQRVPSDRRVCQTTADSSRNRSARRRQTAPSSWGRQPTSRPAPPGISSRRSHVNWAGIRPTHRRGAERDWASGTMPAGPTEGRRAHWSLERGQDAGLHLLK